MNTKKADMIIDLQYGSTGKGLIAGYLAEKEGYDVCVTANMPNAGHTYIDSKDQKMVHKVLPNGVVSPSCEWAVIGPGAVFSVERLIAELDHLDSLGYSGFRVAIHPNACVLLPRHINGEDHLHTIGSTKQGSAAAMIEKINRRTDPGHCLARNYKDIIPKKADEVLTEGRVEVVSHEDYRMIISCARRILLEGAQGYSLGINQPFWPYATSRECTPARFMSDMMIPLPMLTKVIGVARVHPIRVGGTSGGCYDDQEELTWQKVGQIPELTTVTQRERRVFGFSYRQMNDAIWETQPDEIFLNFCNYDKNKALEIRFNYPDRIRYMGWGPAQKDVEEV